MEVHIMMFQLRHLGVELPNTVELEVTETEPGIKGDTAIRWYRSLLQLKQA